MAHPDAATTNGYTPLHISAREGQLETAAVLLEAGASHSLPTKVRLGQNVVCNHILNLTMAEKQQLFSLSLYRKGLLLCM